MKKVIQSHFCRSVSFWFYIWDLEILFEYVLKIPMGFYNIPIIIAFLAAILVACLQNRNVKFDEKLELMAQGLADKNIITMLLIFLTAGTFVGVVGRSSAESVAYFMLAVAPRPDLPLLSCLLWLVLYRRQWGRLSERSRF